MALPEDPVPLPLDGTLDLHQFAPRECAAVLEAYLDAAQEAGLREIRVIHGKGIGTLQALTHATLRRHPAVRGFALADAAGGGWGATVVRL